MRTIRATFGLFFVMTVLATSTGCRTIAKSLFHGLIGGDDRYSSRGDLNEPGISRREKRRRFEEINMRKAMSSPDWHWSPGE